METAVPGLSIYRDFIDDAREVHLLKRSIVRSGLWIISEDSNAMAIEMNSKSPMA